MNLQRSGSVLESAFIFAELLWKISFRGVLEYSSEQLFVMCAIDQLFLYMANELPYKYLHFLILNGS